MKASYPLPSRLTCLTLSLLALLTSTPGQAAFVLSEATSLFTPSFRGAPGTTYFGWSNGSWDGNADAVPPDAPIPDTLNGTPSINPTGYGVLLTQAVPADIISGSNNLYSSVTQINSLGLQLTIPTAGTIGIDGFTTIIIQGTGLNGAMFGANALDGFGFGSINGIAPTYFISGNAANKGQWWAKWELTGNQSSYTVDIFGAQVGAEPLAVSVTDLIVDTQFSNTSFAADIAMVPEPSSALLSLLGAFALLRRNRH